MGTTPPEFEKPEDMDGTFIPDGADELNHMIHKVAGLGEITMEEAIGGIGAGPERGVRRRKLSAIATSWRRRSLCQGQNYKDQTM